MEIAYAIGVRHFCRREAHKRGVQIVTVKSKRLAICCSFEITPPEQVGKPVNKLSSLGRKRAESNSFSPAHEVARRSMAKIVGKQNLNFKANAGECARLPLNPGIVPDLRNYEHYNSARGPSAFHRPKPLLERNEKRPHLRIGQKES